MHNTSSEHAHAHGSLSAPHWHVASGRHPLFGNPCTPCVCDWLQIKTLLLKLARESCLACLSSLQERISILQERPTELDMFMAYQVMQPGLMLASPPAAVNLVTKPSSVCSCWHAA